MEKSLRQVMPDLKTNAAVMARMDEISVERAAKTRDGSEVRLYLSAPFVIARRDINALEAAVRQKYFPSGSIRVRVIERFDVPEMSPEEIWRVYRDSFELEMKLHHLVCYKLLAGSQLSFEEDRIRMTVPDSVAYRARADETARLLEELYRNRFGKEVTVRKTAGSAPAVSVDEQGLREEVGEIARQYEENQQAGEERRLREAAGKAKRPGGEKRVIKRKIEEGSGYGYDFEEEPLPISAIQEEMGEVVVQGRILDVEERELRTGNLLEIFPLTDRTDTIKCKLFLKPEEKEALSGIVRKNGFVKLKGVAAMDKFDREITISAVSGLKKTEGDTHVREDRAPVKRVELHAHTQMSEMDAVTHTEDLIRRAAAWGHRAVAITDHGVVQSFTDAFHLLQDPKLNLKGKIKIIYGCEGYLVDDRPGMTKEEILQAKTYHIVLLAANDTGRVNLYRLVSESHLNYFRRRPRIPRSLLTECREGLIIGSACQAGELYQAILNGADEEKLARLVNFYDYLEVQPIMNNAFLLRDTRPGMRKTEEELRDLVRKVVSLGEQFGKPVVATSDVHFLDPEDEIYRRIIQKGQGYTDADDQPPLFLRTTDEMLEAFEFLGREKAEEIVVTNSNLICDRIEEISPVRPDKCPPVIPGSEEELQAMCEKRAHELYGDPLPPIVEERMRKELSSIIGNGYAVMYIIAQRLVKKSNDDGYLVGSRGSVGSSFVAYLSGITEVNSLAPHYRCPRCRHSIFDNEETRAHAGGAGVDMKDMDCPVCGGRMIKDGYDIPFETFLGFKGDKEPDIDLNFSGEYQSRAHEYTEVLFGKGHTFKAGTISTLAEKTAFGFVLKYYEEKGVSKRRCEIERIAAGCEGVRRSTGQHPGGIVVMPHGENIYSFTPIQHPANDVNSKIVTTHFDYHSIDHNLLKLDILGHDDPTMIRRLEDLIGIKATEIPLDDPAVISLFKSPEALGITSGQIGGCPLGTLGIPEFGTDFAMKIVLDAKPTCFADLVRIAGIAHGTNVWLGNVQDLILNGTATLSEAICTRDDIMLYLISMQLEPALSFQIMESVRKGKVAGKKEKNWPVWKEKMLAAGVPEWYTGSCEKIQYMFPKAHAAAYVMMAWRVAYCKIHHPLEYYTAYYSIRADGFNYELMCRGDDELRRNLELFRRNQDDLSDADKLTYRDMRLVEEMRARGIEFTPIDLYTASADRFKIVDGKIMPSFTSIAGMGVKAAQDLEAAAAKGRFLSREDLIDRSHISSTLAETLAQLGILGDIPASNQLSFADWLGS